MSLKNTSSSCSAANCDANPCDAAGGGPTPCDAMAAACDAAGGGPNPCDAAGGGGRDEAMAAAFDAAGSGYSQNACVRGQSRPALTRMRPATSPSARLTTVEPPSDSLPLRCRRESREPRSAGERSRMRHRLLNYLRNLILEGAPQPSKRFGCRLGRGFGGSLRGARSAATSPRNPLDAALTHRQS